ncbi:hypothetical protein [Herpetosiphon gulosus]|uniref:hypothetical protein n=1 Tax=Herpetosiphon gulosus TaxID=1973496 RepID=UPI0031E89230
MYYCPACEKKKIAYAARKAGNPTTPATDAIPTTYLMPQRFVCWPTEVSPDGMEALAVAVSVMKTKAQARDVVTLIWHMLYEYRAAIVRWLVLEGLLNDPSVIPDRLAFFLFIDEDREDVLWWRQLLLIQPRLAKNGTLGVRMRVELEDIVMPLLQFFMKTQFDGVGFEQQIAPDHHATVTYHLATALCQLEARLAVEVTWTIEDWLGGDEPVS